MSAKACRCKKVECEECPEWIFTFADLVMLMMGFFVILWVLKPQPGKQGSSDAEEYLVKIEASIRGGFGYVPNPTRAEGRRGHGAGSDQHPAFEPCDRGRKNAVRPGERGADR